MKKSKDKVERTFGIPIKNYRFIIIGAIVIFIGYLLMIGGASKDPNVFSTAIFSFRRIVLSPIVILLGFGIEIYAIMHKPHENQDKEIQNQDKKA